MAANHSHLSLGGFTLSIKAWAMKDLVFRLIVNACRQADAFHFLLLKKRCDDVVENKKPKLFVRHELHG